ncbi:MAG: amidohydrolase family protein [Candidatus Eremiobacteraeota bacterium]|nr:amidohydrolase family protein [Candidatus Eremiobacteraeota bacterium]
MTAPSLRIRTGRLYDGSLDAPKTNVVVTIADGKFGAIEPADGKPADREIAALVPGLINAHAHLEMNGEPQTVTIFRLRTPEQRLLACVEAAKKSLVAGVTTIRDLGGSGRNALDLRDAINRGALEGPTVIAAGAPIVMTGGHGWWAHAREADGPWDVRKAVREQLKAGADCIKVMATGGVLTPGAVPGNDQLTEEEMRAAIVEARTHGMRVAAHAIGTSGIKNAIRAGVTSIEHGSLIDDEGIALMKERGTMLVPTLNALMGIVENADAGGIPEYAICKAHLVEEQMRVGLLRAKKAGVKIAGGSDAGTPFNRHEDYAREVELMTQMLEMTPREALHAATQTAAELLGVGAGRIVADAPADCILLDRDLESDVRALFAPRAVYKTGRNVFERA